MMPRPQPSIKKNSRVASGGTFEEFCVLLGAHASCLHHKVFMILRLATANEDGRSGMEFSLRAVLPPCRLKPELHACFGGTDRHATVGAALCGASPPTQGRPYGFTDCNGSWESS